MSNTTSFKVGEWLVVARPSTVAPEHVCDFWIFEEVGSMGEGDDEVKLYGSFCGETWQEPESFDGASLDEMDPTLRGSVKWDGCSNWDFQPDNVLVHFCEPEDVQKLADVVKACIAKGEELIPAWMG